MQCTAAPLGCCGSSARLVVEEWSKGIDGILPQSGASALGGECNAAAEKAMYRSAVAVASFVSSVPPQYEFSNSNRAVKAFLLPLWNVSGIDMAEKSGPNLIKIATKRVRQ